MCQLVLGAGAMQVSGLRSITAKHLALSSQCLSACMALHPLLRPLLTATLPTPRLGLILPEFDRLMQVSSDTAHGHQTGGCWSVLACCPVLLAYCDGLWCCLGQCCSS